MLYVLVCHEMFIVLEKGDKLYCLAYNVAKRSV